MTTNTDMNITWGACNNDTSLYLRRSATTMRAAVRAARHYLENEMFGEGTITYFVNDRPVREDEKSLFTRGRWDVRNI